MCWALLLPKGVALSTDFFNRPENRRAFLVAIIFLFAKMILMLNKIKKLIPRFLFDFYHWLLAYTAAFVYGHPSRQMVVIGVTGTGGKSTVVNLIGRILEEAGYKIGWTTTFNFKIAEREWINKTKMTMLGRFALQKLLKQMVAAGCRYTIIETSSEGILQFRHLGIDYDVVVFTNLSPEHLERHGSFENYRMAKGKLFDRLSSPHKIIDGKKIKKISVANLDDSQADYFLRFPADEYWGFTTTNNIKQITNNKTTNNQIKIIKAENILSDSDGSRFIIHNSRFIIHLLGEFNVANALAAIAVARSQGIGLEVCQRALAKIPLMAGRMEVVVKEPFKVVVDYAHTPDELEKVYQTFSGKNLICVLGAAGGGRDKWKRPELGKIADQYGAEIIITNEDPYDEDPQKIIDEVASRVKNHHLYKTLDRGQAIAKALSLVKPGEVVIITGKGSEQCIMGPNGQKIPWNDKQAVKDVMLKMKN